MDLQEHYDAVIRALLRGHAVPFLGAGANLCGRPEQVSWQREYLPNGPELSEFLADTLDFPKATPAVLSSGAEPPTERDIAGERGDLTRVTQYLVLRDGTGPLYDELHSLLDIDYPVTALHRFLARVPAALRGAGYRDCYQVIITTNYDDVLERAFAEEQEPFDLLTYVAEGSLRGKFWHRPPGGKAVLVRRPNKYLGATPAKRTVIVKIHGAVNRVDSAQDSYVVTEDNYIDFLTHTEVAGLFPAEVAAKLLTSHFLFLGHRLSDWNLRVILRRIWGDQKLTYKSWAVQLHSNFIDERSWAAKDVTIIRADLKVYIEGLDRRLSERLQRSPLL